MGKQINQHDSTFGISISATGENMEHAESRVGKRKASHHAMPPVGVCQKMSVEKAERKWETGNWKSSDLERARRRWWQNLGFHRFLPWLSAFELEPEPEP